MINLLNWFKQPEKPVVKFVYTGMDLKTWRETPELVAFARALWADQKWQHALSALKNALPYGYPIRGNNLSDVQAALELGRKEGYQDCMTALFSLPTRMDKPIEEVEADYDPKDYNKPDDE